MVLDGGRFVRGWKRHEYFVSNAEISGELVGMVAVCVLASTRM